MRPHLEIGQNNQTPKYKQVVKAILDLIKKGKLKKGQKLLSINELSEQYSIARVTVEKGYKILQDKGIIISIRGKGFYVSKVTTDGHYRILLVFNKISNYKKQIYNSFVLSLGSAASVDLKIHHFNHNILRDLVEKHLNDYDYFVIMPHFYDEFEEALKILKKIPLDQLVILDRRIPYFDFKCPMVYQDFEKNIIDSLTEALDHLKKYSKLYFVYSNLVPYPQEMMWGFKKFCMQNFFKNEVIREVTDNTSVHKEEAYIVIEETDLAQLIKNAMSANLKFGKDVGLISYNETPVKSVLLDGITVLSTDHEKMGETAARLILENSKELIENPFQLIIRNSL